MASVNQAFMSQYGRLYRPLLNQMNGELSAFGLSNSHWSVMKLLKSEEGLTLTEIAHRQFVEKPSVTKVLQKLDEAGYIDVTAGEDKREKKIALSAAGESAFAEITDRLNALYGQLLSGVAEEDLRRMMQVFAQIEENIGKG